MRSLLSIFLMLLLAFSIILSANSTEKEIDPEIYLQKADKAVKEDPDRSMDLSKSALMFLKGSGNDFLEIKAKLIIAKAWYYKGEAQKALKTLANIKARISIFQIENSEIEYNSLFAESYYWMGEVYLKLNRYNKSLESYQKGLEYCDPENHTVISSKLTIAISRIFIFLSEYEKVMDYAIKGIKSSEASGDHESLFFSHYYHGYVYRLMNDLDKGLIKFRKSLEISELYKRVDLRIMAINEISNIYILRKQYEKALTLKKEALNLSEQTENNRALSFCLNDIALIFIKKEEYAKALPYFIRSKDLAGKEGNIRGEITTDLNMARTYMGMGELEKSRKTALAAIKLAEKYSFKSEAMHLTEFLSELSLIEKKYKDAYKYLKNSNDLNKEIFSSEKGIKIAELEAEIEMEKSESKILLLEKINELKQLELDEKNEFITIQKVATLFLIIIVVIIFLAYRMKMKTNFQLRKKSEELEKTLTEIHQLSGLLPICSSCKKIRDDGGYWHQVEEYIKSHSEASFSHSLCPVCIDKVYPKRKNGKKSVKKKNPVKKK